MTFAILILLVLPIFCEAQFKDKFKRKTEDAVEEGVNSLFGNKKKEKENSEADTNEETGSNTDENSQKTATTTEEEKALLKWAKYDFVLGDQIIFEDDLLFEENGEFPSR